MRTSPVILAALVALFVALSPLAVAAQAVDLGLAPEGEAPDSGTMLRLASQSEVAQGVPIRLVPENEAPSDGVRLRLAVMTDEMMEQIGKKGTPYENWVMLKIVLMPWPWETENLPPENMSENLPPENLPLENLPPENLPPENAPPEQPETQPVWISVVLATPETLDDLEGLQTVRLVTAEEAGLENMQSVRLVLAESGEP